MSSDTTISALDPTSRPRRPYQVIVLVDRDTLREVNRRRGTGARKLSKSEVAYRLLTQAIAADRPAADDERRSGMEDRRQTA